MAVWDYRFLLHTADVAAMCLAPRDKKKLTQQCDPCGKLFTVYKFQTDACKTKNKLTL